jgi:hypothetical protein
MRFVGVRNRKRRIPHKVPPQFLPWPGGTTPGGLSGSHYPSKCATPHLGCILRFAFFQQLPSMFRFPYREQKIERLLWFSGHI